VAVGTQDTKVLESVVRVITVRVMELESEWLTEPLGASAVLATVLLEACGNQSPSDRCTTSE
jgi:hypothetical protein